MTKPKVKTEIGYGSVINDSGNPKFIARMLVGTPSTGLVRIEWHQARANQVVPVNWSQVQMIQYLNSYIPLNYQVADAQNIICRECVEKDYEWLLLWESDNIPLPDALIRVNEYMIKKEVPIVSGLYYTKSRPTYPLVFRGVGNTSFYDWKMGDLVWCDGVPTGFLLIHGSIIKTMWQESPEYLVNYGLQPVLTRRIFQTPMGAWYDPQTEAYNTIAGTSDLDWCKRVMNDKIFEKAGWSKYQEMEFPFLVDTNIFVKHISPDGVVYP